MWHILETDQDVCEIPPTASPEEGEEYFQLGLSALTQENSPFSVKRGVFISREFSDGTKHYLGSAGSNPGDSGGGCFSETQNLLFGINVGADNLPILGNMARLATTLTYNLSPIFAARFGVPLAVFGGSAVWLVSAVCAAALMQIIGSNQDYSEDDGDTIREPAQNVNPSQVRNFGISFWYLFVIIISLYGSVVPFFPIASDCCFY